MCASATMERPPAFGAMLRTWRRERRISQLDLSLSCEVSQRHVSFLESGRSKPSRRMILTLANALDVPLRERNQWLHTAGFAPEYRESDLDEATMAPVYDALRHMLRYQDPFPALVVDSDYNLLMTNPAFDRLLGVFGDPEAIWQACCPDGRRNLLRLTFNPHGMRAAIANLSTVAPVLLNRAWQESIARRGRTSPVLEDLRADRSLEAYWHLTAATQTATGVPVLPLQLQVGAVTLKLLSMISVFGTATDITADELRVESFFPADEDSENFLRRLAPH